MRCVLRKVTAGAQLRDKSDPFLFEGGTSLYAAVAQREVGDGSESRIERAAVG